MEALTLPSCARVEDLCLCFQFSPASKVHGYSAHDLKPGGDSMPLTTRNMEEFSDLVGAQFSVLLLRKVILKDY